MAAGNYHDNLQLLGKMHSMLKGKTSQEPVTNENMGAKLTPKLETLGGYSLGFGSLSPSAHSFSFGHCLTPQLKSQRSSTTIQDIKEIVSTKGGSDREKVKQLKNLLQI